MHFTENLISCICVTRAKPGMLNRAIACFHTQTWHNKELVIVYETDDLETAEYIHSLPDHPSLRIIAIPREDGHTLGALRNLANDAAHGEYVCQWDDDDWYHTGRLEYMHTVITETGYSGCIMTNWLIFDVAGKRWFVSNTRLWEGSIFCRRNLLAGGYELKRSGEDTRIVQQLFDAGMLFAINAVPQLYVYHYHGSNTWGAAHWQRIFDAGTPVFAPSGLSDTLLLADPESIFAASRRLDELMPHPIFAIHE